MKQIFTYKKSVGLCLLLLLLCLQYAHAQYPKLLNQYPAATDGSVNTLNQKGSTLYMGGNFAHLGPETKYFGFIYNSVNDASPIANYPQPNGGITAAISDGAGGFYIFANTGASIFDHVGGVPRNGLARINADGGLNDWASSGSISSSQSLPTESAVKVGNAVIVGVDNFTSSPIIALDATTGAVLPGWDNLGISSMIWARKMLVSNNTLYILGVDANYVEDLLYAVDVTDVNHPSLISTFQLDAQNSNGSPLSLTDMAIADNTIYLTGFQYNADNDVSYNNKTLSGLSFNSALFAVNATTGAFIKSFNTPLANTEYGAGLAIDGNKLFLTSQSGTTGKLLAYDRQSGADISSSLPALNLTGTTGAQVISGLLFVNYNKITITDDHKLIIYGGFDKVNGTSQNGATIDLTANTLVNWNLQTSFDGSGYGYDPSLGPSVITVNNNGQIYVGGNIQEVAPAQARNGLAAVNITNGALLPWSPTDLTGTINASAIYNNTLYLGGSFTGPAGIKNLVAYDISDPVNPVFKSDWSPNPDNTVDALFVNGTKLYAGGDFINMGTQSQKRVAEFDISAATGTLNTAWNPSPDNTVSSFTALNNILYIGGTFANVGAIGRSHAAAFDLNSGNALTAWDAQIPTSGNNFLSALAAQPADGSNHAARIFLIGVFQVSGSAKSLYTVDASTGSADALTVGGGLPIQATVATTDHNNLYIGSNNIYSLDISTNASPVTTYVPSVTQQIKSIITGDGLLFAGGDFLSIDDPSIQGLLAFQTGVITPQITFVNLAKTYGDADAKLTATSTNTTTPITYVLSTQKDVNGNTATIANITTDGKLQVLMPGTATITASQAAGTGYTAAADVAVTLKIAKKTLTIKADDATKVFSDVNPNFTTTTTGYTADNDTEKGKVTGAAVVKVSDPANAGADPGASPAVGAYDLVVDTTAMHSDYYYFATTNGHFTVTKSLQTITVTNVPAAVTYGDTPATLAVSSTGTADITVSSSDQNVATVTKDATNHFVLNAKGAGTATITFNQAADANHEAGTVDQTVTIAKKPLDSVVMDDKTILTGQALPDFTTTIKLFVRGDTTATAISPALQFSTTATNTNTAGVYDINIDNYGSLTSANYILPATYAKGKLTIGSLAFNNIAKTYGDAPFNPGATASQSGTPTYTLSDQSVASYDAGTGLVTIKGAGTTNITASLNGSSVTRSLTVAPKAVTVSADNATKNYGDANPTIAVHYSGFISGENETNITPFTAATATVSATLSSDAGNYNITLAGASAANYTFAYTTGAILTVNKAPLTITADNQTKVYGQANPTLTITYAGFVNNDDQSKLTTPATASTVAIASSAVGSYPITLSQAVATNYTITQNNGTLTLTPAPLTVTADNFTRDRGKPNPTFTITYSGFANGDNAASLTTQATATSAAVPNSPAGTYPIIPAGAVGSNYTYIYVNGALTVNGNQLLTYNPFSVMTYGDVDFDPMASSDQGGTPTYTTSNPSVATIVGGKVHINGAGTADVTATFPAAGGYNISTDKQTLTVQKKNLTIAADDKSRNFGASNPVLTLTYTGFANNDNATNGSLITQANVSTTATPTSPVGIYPITVNGAASNNYNLVYVNGNLTINAAVRTIAFNALPAKTYGDVDFNPGATTNTDETLVYTVTDPTVATIVNGQIHITGAGSTTVTATLPANAGYSGATTASQTLTVGKASLTITADNKTKTQGPPDITLTATYSGFVNNDNELSLTVPATLTTNAKADSPTGTYTIIVNGAISKNYDIKYVNATLTIVFGIGQDQIVVHPMLSPNGDGKNDFMLIDGIQNYPDNHVLVVNRNGAKVYEARGYDNSSIVFSGKNNDGNSLVAGTYYYEINYTLKGNSQRKTGYIIIKY